MAIRQARLLYGATYGAESTNTDLFWLVRMPLFDPHILFEFKDESGRWERILFTYPLELKRAQKQARNCDVQNLEPYFEKLGRGASLRNVIKMILEERGFDTVTVHPLTPVGFVEAIRASGLNVIVGKRPWFEERLIKTEEEIGYILEVQGQTEDVLRLVENRLRRATIADGLVMENDKPLTSEELRSFVELELYRRGCVSLDTIIPSGGDAALPHELGSGPIRAHTGIVCDIYPYSKNTGYFSDMTRTFVKGSPPALLGRMYDAVLKAQEMAIKMIHSGVNGSDIQTAVEDSFKNGGFRTDADEGCGFIHSVGHGLGLLCHEPPAGIGKTSYVLTAGLVTSVEPGLYYPQDRFGVRI